MEIRTTFKVGLLLLLLLAVALALGAADCGGPDPEPSTPPPDPDLPPLYTYKVTMDGECEIVDHENILNNEKGTMPIQGEYVLKLDGSLSAPFNFPKCVGGEVRVEFKGEVTMGKDHGVIVAGKFELYEGDNCNTTDKEDSQDFKWTVPPNGKIERTIKLVNSGSGGGDSADLTVMIANVVKRQ